MRDSDSDDGLSAAELIDKRIAALGDWRGRTLGRIQRSHPCRSRPQHIQPQGTAKATEAETRFGGPGRRLSMTRARTGFRTRPIAWSATEPKRWAGDGTLRALEVQDTCRSTTSKS